MCVFYDQSSCYIHSAFSSRLYTFIIHSIVRNFSWSMPMARHPHMWWTLVHLTSLLDLLANIYNYHSSMCVAIILSDGLFNYQCPRVVFIVLFHHLPHCSCPQMIRCILLSDIFYFILSLSLIALLCTYIASAHQCHVNHKYSWILVHLTCHIRRMTFRH